MACLAGGVLGEVEVGDLEDWHPAGVPEDEEVGGLDVADVHTGGVQVAERERELLEDEAGGGLRQAARALDEPEDVAAVRELHHDAQEVLRAHDRVHLDDVRVVQAAAGTRGGRQRCHQRIGGTVGHARPAVQLRCGLFVFKTPHEATSLFMQRAPVCAADHGIWIRVRSWFVRGVRGEEWSKQQVSFTQRPRQRACRAVLSTQLALLHPRAAR